MHSTMWGQLSELVRDLKLAVIVINAEGVVQWSNDLCLEIFPKSSAKIGQAMIESFPALNVPAVIETLQAVMGDKESRRFKIMVRPKPEARARPVIVRILPWSNGYLVLAREKGSLAVLDGMGGEARTYFAPTNSDDFYWSIDLTTQKIHWSTTAFEWFGVPEDERDDFTWDSWLSRVHPDDREDVELEARETVQAPRTGWATECRLRRGSGEYAQVAIRSLAVMENAQGRILMGSVSDLSLVRAAEARLRQQEAALIDASGQSAMEVMASTIAHEINQPLTAAAAYLGAADRLVKGEDADIESVLDALSLAKESLERSGSIVRQIRHVVDRQQERVGTLNLRGIIEDATAYVLMRRSGAQGILLSLDVPAGIAVQGNRAQLQQMMVSLVRNALRSLNFSPSKELTITGAAQDGKVVVEFLDSGPGARNADGNQAFEVFGPTAPIPEGIGLSLARTIAESHSGRLWPARMPDGGMKLVVELPVVD